MKLLHALVGLSLAAALGLLWFGELLFLAPGVIGAGLVLFGLQRRIGLPVHLGFLALALAAVFSAWGEAPPLAMLTSLCASLAAWDVASYILLLRYVGSPPEAAVTRRRLLRLGVGLIAGWGLGTAALSFRVELGFGVLLVLGLGVVLGLAFSMLYLRRKDENML